ncbi:MAG: alkaline phosphatase family protein, partial [Candidatus Sumerlaeaceae bacterium]|nr:alkaline phosphatase family protein [Candidatus Sumerlaeaceae bacterium]
MYVKPQSKRFLAAAALALISVLQATFAAPPPKAAQSKSVASAFAQRKLPRLAVVVVFDQFAYEYLARFSDLYLPPVDPKTGRVGGFRYLTEKGACFVDAHFSHIPTFTGPGHSVLMTGAPLSETGIVGNSWITPEGKRLNCVEDPDQKVVGADKPRARAASPVNLRASTLGDELRLATNDSAKVVGIAIKDRGSVLMAGHKPSACVWFDDGTGNWVTSTWYTTSTLPRFAEKVNKERLADRWFGAVWDRALPPQVYTERCRPSAPDVQGDAGGLGPGWPKKLAPPNSDVPDKSYYARLTNSPYGVKMTFLVAQAAVEEEKLGSDEIPDLLTVSQSTPDYALHSYGPNSEEALDMAVNCDRELSDFFNFLNANIPGGLDSVVIVVTADHGICPIPEIARQAQNVQVGHVDSKKIEETALKALSDRIGDTTLAKSILFGYSEPYIYLDRSLASERHLDLSSLRSAVATKILELEGVYTVFTYDQIARGQLPHGRLAELVYNGFDPKRSGDVVVILEPGWLPGSGYKGTSHGSPWNYDTHIPLLFAGRDIVPGLYT